jgi:hypothetical protein
VVKIGVNDDFFSLYRIHASLSLLSQNKKDRKMRKIKFSAKTKFLTTKGISHLLTYKNGGSKLIFLDEI